jgi:hypothetical protein
MNAAAAMNVAAPMNGSRVRRRAHLMSFVIDRF